MKNYLEFEKDIKNLEEEIAKLKDPFGDEGISSVDTDKIFKIQNRVDEKLAEVYSGLNRWQKTLVARHEDRPRAGFFIENLFRDFINLSGDRLFGDDKSVLAGFAKFKEQSVLVIGQDKGSDLDTRIKHNFGMMRPEGYRKCNRLMKLANKFNIPIIFFIDTPGAYPGVGAEQRGQAEAIASAIECSLSLEVPTISVIIGEGGSGGAIALASTNKVLMFEHSIYSVISSEGCASILWRDPSKAPEAAEAMKLSSKDLFEQNIIDEIIKEPIGGAHRDRNQMVLFLRESLQKNLAELLKLEKKQIINQRRQKFLNMGRNKVVSKISSDEKRLDLKKGFLSNLAYFFSNYNKKIIYLISFILLMAIIYFLF